jgi:chorismate mutase
MKMSKNWMAPLILVANYASSAEVLTQTCEQIREQIKTQTGELVQVDTTLLQSIAARQECGFTSAEVYRAAYGDKPLPKQEARATHREHEYDDD